MAHDPTEEDDRRRDRPPVEFVRPDEGQSPLPPRDQQAAWIPRPEDYRPPEPWAAPRQPPAGGPSNLPMFAGILLVLAGVVGMAGAIYNALSLPSVADYADFVNNNSPELVATLQLCGLLSIWSQALAILGGVMAFLRMNWRLTLVCAVFSLFTLGIVYFEASAIGLVALIVTVLARPYFLS